MSPRTVTNPLLRDAPLVREDEPVGQATRELLGSGLPALPVIGKNDRLVGIFGERELLEAVFPGYLKQLKYAGFVKRGLEDSLQKHAECREHPVGRYMNTEHVDVGTEFSDVEVAEIFLHHRVLLVPVTDDGRVTAVITRADFFRTVAERLIGG